MGREKAQKAQKRMGRGSSGMNWPQQNAREHKSGAFDRVRRRRGFHLRQGFQGTPATVGDVFATGRSAGLRPAAALPFRMRLNQLRRLGAPALLRLAEPSSGTGAFRACQGTSVHRAGSLAQCTTYRGWSPRRTRWRTRISRMDADGEKLDMGVNPCESVEHLSIPAPARCDQL